MSPHSWEKGPCDWTEILSFQELCENGEEQNIYHKSDEESLFQVDKQISEALQKLLDTVSLLPQIEKERKHLRVMIKNAFL